MQFYESAIKREMTSSKLEVREYNESSQFNQLKDGVCTGHLEGRIIPESLLTLAFTASESPQQPFTVYVGYNESAIHSLPIAINMLSNLLLHQALRENKQGWNASGNKQGWDASGNKQGWDGRGNIKTRAHMMPFNPLKDVSETFISGSLNIVGFSPLVVLANIAGLVLLAFIGSEIVSNREVLLCSAPFSLIFYSIFACNLK